MLHAAWDERRLAKKLSQVGQPAGLQQNTQHTCSTAQVHLHLLQVITPHHAMALVALPPVLASQAQIMKKVSKLAGPLDPHLGAVDRALQLLQLIVLAAHGVLLQLQ